MREPAVIFDFGNVVAFFDYLKACERLGPRLGLTAEAFRKRITERGFAPFWVDSSAARFLPNCSRRSS